MHLPLLMRTLMAATIFANLLEFQSSSHQKTISSSYASCFVAYDITHIQQDVVRGNINAVICLEDYHASSEVIFELFAIPIPYFRTRSSRGLSHSFLASQKNSNDIFFLF